MTRLGITSRVRDSRRILIRSSNNQWCTVLLAVFAAALTLSVPSSQPCAAAAFLGGSAPATSSVPSDCRSFSVVSKHAQHHHRRPRRTQHQQQRHSQFATPSLLSMSSTKITTTVHAATEADGVHHHEIGSHVALPVLGAADKVLTVWEELALLWIGRSGSSSSGGGSSSGGVESTKPLSQRSDYAQTVTLLRVGIPALFYAVSAKIAYPTVALALAASIHDSGVFAVVAQDASQYIQNVLTTSGLVFSLLVGQTYYFMYQQQEATYLALYEEVTMAKSLLEQTALVCQGRESLYRRILTQIDLYVKTDLQRFNDVEPAVMLSARPCDDPMEEILFLTSVGEPSIVYQTVRSLRQARAYRLGALQKKLPSIHMTLLWTLFGIVLFTFPLLGAGSQTIGGLGILNVQSYYLGFIVFGMALVMGVVYELQRPGDTGAYNARAVLAVMVEGLEQELEQRLNGQNMILQGTMTEGPSVDSDGYMSADASIEDDNIVA
jgi:hypothetical protein